MTAMMTGPRSWTRYLEAHYLTLLNIFTLHTTLYIQIGLLCASHVGCYLFLPGIKPENILAEINNTHLNPQFLDYEAVNPGPRKINRDRVV